MLNKVSKACRFWRALILWSANHSCTLSYTWRLVSVIVPVTLSSLSWPCLPSSALPLRASRWLTRLRKATGLCFLSLAQMLSVVCPASLSTISCECDKTVPLDIQFSDWIPRSKLSLYQFAKLFCFATNAWTFACLAEWLHPTCLEIYTQSCSSIAK